MSSTDSSFRRSAGPWFVLPRAVRAPRLRLFCLPFAGGNAAAYHRWAAGLPDDVELFSVQLPGRAFRLREPPIVDPAEMRLRLTDVISEHLDRPFVLFGHSMGALLAFEVARSLRRRGAPSPLHVIVSGRRAPQLTKTEPVYTDLPDDVFWERVGEVYGTPRVVLENPSLREMLLPVLRADLDLLRRFRYAPEPPLAVPLTALCGTADPMVSRADLEAWREQTTSRFERDWFSGGHMFLLEQEAQVLGRIRRVVGA